MAAKNTLGSIPPPIPPIPPSPTPLRSKKASKNLSLERLTVPTIPPNATPQTQAKTITTAIPALPPFPPTPSLQIHTPVVPNHSPPRPSTRASEMMNGMDESPPVRSFPRKKNVFCEP